MELDKFILAVVTTQPEKIPVGGYVFHCHSIEEMDYFAANLEAILDGIAHKLSDEIYIIVKH
ncbi:capping complex subunit for YIEGIA [Peribacillus acanthi]|uniref:capping complex subunit for YIEGIA n=1 Tax=Peribacillus acanthi TaxID=2171554 RepID=UPI000D3E7B4D|nr:hypothetical protein [Peribacillus acanthi]